MRPRETPRILVVGSVNIDLVAEVPRIPRAGETVLARRLRVHEGGKGANQAVAAARAGGSVAIVAAVGRDAHGSRLRESLSRAGVGTAHLEEVEGETGTALICVDGAGQNSIAVVPGANGLLGPEAIRRAAFDLPEARTLLLQLEVPVEAVEAAVRVAAARGMRVILNPAPARPLAAPLLAAVEVLTPNESEAEVLTGLPVAGAEGAWAAAERLLGAGVRAVVVTLGAGGAVLATRSGERRQIPAFPARVVDSTGAGDAFNGALAVALTEGAALEDAVRFACAAGALAVTREGAQRSAPTRAEIDRVLGGGPVDVI